MLVQESRRWVPKNRRRLALPPTTTSWRAWARQEVWFLVFATVVVAVVGWMIVKTANNALCWDQCPAEMDEVVCREWCRGGGD